MVEQKKPYYCRFTFIALGSTGKMKEVLEPATVNKGVWMDLLVESLLGILGMSIPKLNLSKEPSVLDLHTVPPHANWLLSAKQKGFTVISDVSGYLWYTDSF